MTEPDKTPGQMVLEEAKADLDAYRVDYAAMQERWTRVREAHEAAIDLRLEELTDAEIMADEATLRWVLREGFSHSGAARVKKRLAHIDVQGLRGEGGYDGRDEWAEHMLPILHIALVRDQETAEAAEVIREWAEVWALGRPDVPLDITERTLSEHGSYGGMYDVASGTATVRKRVWGRDQPVVSGPLDEVLAHLAKHVWYERAQGDDPIGMYDDEDED